MNCHSTLWGELLFSMRYTQDAATGHGNGKGNKGYGGHPQPYTNNSYTCKQPMSGASLDKNKGKGKKNSGKHASKSGKAKGLPPQLPYTNPKTGNMVCVYARRTIMAIAGSDVLASMTLSATSVAAPSTIQRTVPRESGHEIQRVAGTHHAAVALVSRSLSPKCMAVLIAPVTTTTIINTK
jgi:hypothetical protein